MSSSANSEAPCKEGKATEDHSGHCHGNTAYLRKKSMDQTVQKEHGDSPRVSVTRQEGVADGRSIGDLPSPIVSSHISPTAVLDDDDCIPEELKYSSADSGMVVADITNDSNTAREGVILDRSGAAPNIATSRKWDGGFQCAD